MSDDNGSNASRRSSSQASRTSNDSRKIRTVRGQPKRAGSKTSNASLRVEDPSLTSFPSLEPENVPKPGRKTSQPAAETPITRTISQKARERKATLAGLTNASPSVTRSNALFDDSPRPSLEVPGSLHLASDEHIQRLVAKNGAVKLVRQYAEDLAQRDAEISSLRARADNRERELKRLLREADVPTTEIEKRLLRLEQGGPDATAEANSRPKGLDGLMGEAMETMMSPNDPSPTKELGGPVPILEPAPSVRRSSTKASAVSSRQSSRANSILSQTSDPDQTLRPKAASGPGRGAGLQSIFQPPAQSSYFIGGSKLSKKPKAADEVSVKSTQSTRSWTQIFGGKNTTRPRAESLGQGPGNPTSQAESALAKLTKTSTNPQPVTHRGSSSAAQGGTLKARPVGRRTNTVTRLSGSPSHNRKGSNASLPLTVEMDSVIEPADLPPTMTTNNYEASGVITDRFGFIYDQQRRKRQSLQVPKHRKNQLSADVASIRSGDASPPRNDVARSSTPVSIDDEGTKKSWQEYLKPGYYASRPKELLLHTPSAGAIVTVNTAAAAGALTPPRMRDQTVSVCNAEGGLVLPRSTSQPQSTRINATSEGNAAEHAAEHDTELLHDTTPTKMLLEQLNELHDSFQTERMTKWNSFLRAVRAERASNADPTSKNAPEAALLDGELIGIATLGRSTNQRAKYTHFKSLVLAGIPVNLRAKIWAECSGATASRVPGYYEDLVQRSDEGTDMLPDISSQITADIRRTLTDNVFFQNGPGVRRLDEVLRAYSLHNPAIGYCQGMNLIAASLLLICATPEDCFWLLVAVIDTILPSGYFSGSLLTARADQIVLREYVKELLPALSAKLDELGVELEACTFHWFLSLYAGVLTGGEALYRIWDIVLTLHSTEAMPTFNETNRANLGMEFPSLGLNSISVPTTPVFATNQKDTTSATETSQPESSSSSPNGSTHDGTSSPFLFQIALSLLYLNQPEILALDSAASVYTYLNHNVTDHAVSVDALVQASEALGKKIRRADVLEKRRGAVRSLGG